MTRCATTLIIPLLFIAATAAATPATESVNSTDVIGGDTCCFTNPRYSGTCEVTTGPDETCADVLAYLNNQASVGKTYCGNTKVRGGWAQVECETSITPTVGAETTLE
ncbi:MAG: hypothetical protein AB1Z65_07160 [Candidatus Sulfomarinibacteraceae bacterium]